MGPDFVENLEDLDELRRLQKRLAKLRVLARNRPRRSVSLLSVSVAKTHC